jgi:hypothetical protein
LAARVTEQQVRDNLGLVAAETADLTIFIDNATMIVDEELVGKGLSDNRLKFIELHLESHFTVLSIEKGGLTRQKLDEAEEGYRQDFTSKPNLSMTRYGQQALALDTSGSLSKLDSPAGKAEFRVV